MKKFTKILICVLLCLCSISLFGCRKKDTFVYPTSNLQTVGNGGMVVRKGNYAYFVNGFLNANTTNVNKKSTFSVGALMVVKFDNNGNIVKNENDLLADDYYRVMSDKLCGCEASGLYIYGDYLFFTSACQNEDNSGSLAVDRVDFNRVKLDNSSKVEKIYTSEVKNSNLEYNFVNNGNKTVLLVYEKGDNLDDSSIKNRLLNIDVSNKIGKPQTVDTNVTSVILKSEYDNNLGSNVYYVKSDKELKVHNAFENSSNHYQDFKNTVELQFVDGNYVYFEMQDSTKDMFELEKSSKSYSKLFTDVSQYTSLTFSSDYRIILAASNDGDGSIVEYFDLNESNKTKTPILLLSDEEASNINVVCISGDFLIYYDNNSNIKVADISDISKNRRGIEVEPTTIFTLEDADTSYLDFDNDYIYYFKTVNSNKYLHRLTISQIYGECEEEMLGVYQNDDIPKEEEE